MTRLPLIGSPVLLPSLDLCNALAYEESTPADEAPSTVAGEPAVEDDAVDRAVVEPASSSGEVSGICFLRLRHNFLLVIRALSFHTPRLFVILNLH